MKVKAKVKILEKGVIYEPGEVFETTPERAKALGRFVQVLEKAVEKPPKDKMVHSKRVHKK